MINSSQTFRKYRLDTRNWDYKFRASVYQANQAGSELQIISAARNTHVLAAQPKSPGSELYHLSQNPVSLLGTLLLCIARNTASMYSSEHCFYVQLGTLLLCLARNNTSLPASMHSSEPCFYVQLGTLLLCLARNNTSLPPYMYSSEPCFYVQLRTLLLCISRNNTASLLISSLTVAF